MGANQKNVDDDNFKVEGSIEVFIVVTFCLLRTV